MPSSESRFSRWFKELSRGIRWLLGVIIVALVGVLVTAVARGCAGPAELGADLSDVSIDRDVTFNEHQIRHAGGSASASRPGAVVRVVADFAAQVPGDEPTTTGDDETDDDTPTVDDPTTDDTTPDETTTDDTPTDDNGTTTEGETTTKDNDTTDNEGTVRRLNSATRFVSASTRESTRRWKTGRSISSPMTRRAVARRAQSFSLLVREMPTGMASCLRRTGACRPRPWHGAWQTSSAARD